MACIFSWPFLVPGLVGASRSEELIIRVLCPFNKIERVIGRGGDTMKSIRQASGAQIDVDDTKDNRDECVITVTANESPDDIKSMAVEAVLLLQTEINNEDDDTVTIRLLVSSKVIGCIIGKSGSIINEIRKRTKANGRISKGDKPKCADVNDELVEMFGEVGRVRDALVQIVLRLRDDALKDGDGSRNPPVGADSLYSGGSGILMQSLLPSVPPVAPLGYDQRADSGGGLGILSSSSLYGYGSLSMGDSLYGSMSSYSSKLYGGLPPPSTLEILVPANAVGKVIGKAGANLANIRKCLLSRVYRRSYGAEPQGGISPSSSQQLINLEYEYSAHNYHPVPVVFSQAKGSSIWDPEGTKYLYFLSAYSAVNQGHCHPKIMKALQEQAEKLTLSSRAFYNDKFPVFAEHLTSMFGYDMVLPMNTGAEGVETALKLARKWGYEKKKIPKDEAIIVSCCGCFHGRTLAAISMSCDNEATHGFGPLLPGHLKVDFGDEIALEKIFKESGDRIAGFLFEPIQGEAGVIIPPDGYLKAVRDLCSNYNILMIADEIQSGLARSGRMLACDWEEVRPDMVILGKALGGGVIPVSAVLADKEVMLCIQPGEHGSTFGGNPLASAVAIASLDVIRDEKLAERSAHLGDELRQHLHEIQQKFPNYIKEVRGRGLFNAVEFDSKTLPVSAYDICLKMKGRGVLAKPTHDTIVRLTPPLSISSAELQEGSKVLHDVLELDLPKMQKPKPANAPASTICHRCGRNLYG